MHKSLAIIALTLAAITSWAFAAGQAYALSTFQTVQGGTGTTTPSGILSGDNGATGHLNTVVIGSGLTFSGNTLSATGGGSSSGLATSSPISSSNLLVYSSTGAGSAFGVGTSTLNASSPLTGSFTQIGSGGSLGCQTASGSQAGCLSSTDWSTFNNKIGWGQATSTSANQLVYTNSQNLLVSQATSSASSAYTSVWRDANQNAFAQNFVSAATSFPATGGTVTLTSASPRTWIFNDGLSTTETMKLPNATTLTTGTTFNANANTSGAVTVVDSGSNVLATVLAGGSTILTASSTATANGVWDAHAWLGHGNVSGTNILGIGTTSPNWAITAANASGPQLALTGTGANEWTLREAGGNLYFATSTYSATSSASALRIDPNGTLTINNLGTGAVSSSNGTLSSGTLSIGNGGTNATSFAATNGLVAFNGTSLVNFANYTLTSSGLNVVNATTTSLFSSTASSTLLYGGMLGIATTSSWGVTFATTTTISNTGLVQPFASTTASNEGATQTLDFSTGNIQRHYLHANTLFNINATSSFPGDGRYQLVLLQDETGSRTCTFGTPGVLRWVGITPATTTCSTGARSVTILNLLVDKVLGKVFVASTTGSNAY